MAERPAEIGAPPAVPDRSNQTQFNTTIQAWWGWIKSFYQYLTSYATYLDDWEAGLPVADSHELKATTGGTHDDPDNTVDTPHILTDHAHSPGSGYWYISNIKYDTSDDVRQTAISYAETRPSLYVRTRHAGVWSEWAYSGTLGGAGYTRHDDTGSRVPGTVYTNTYNKPIKITISGYVAQTAGGHYFELRINGGFIMYSGGISGDSNFIKMGVWLSEVIMPGETFEIIAGGDATISSWITTR